MTNNATTKRTTTACWKAGERAIVLAFPSNSDHGEYLVGVGIGNNANDQEFLVVKHICPAQTSQKGCWHIQQAVEEWKSCFWWEKAPDSLMTINEPVILNPDWEQMPVPSEALEKLDKLAIHSTGGAKENIWEVVNHA